MFVFKTKCNYVSWNKPLVIKLVVNKFFSKCVRIPPYTISIVVTTESNAKLFISMKCSWKLYTGQRNISGSKNCSGGRFVKLIYRSCLKGISKFDESIAMPFTAYKANGAFPWVHLKPLNVELSLADRSNNYCKINMHTQILVLYCRRGWNKSYIETLLHVDWEQSAGTKLHSGNLHQFLISVQLEQAIESRKAVLFIVTLKIICNFLNIILFSCST